MVTLHGRRRNFDAICRTSIQQKRQSGAVRRPQQRDVRSDFWGRKIYGIKH